MNINSNNIQHDLRREFHNMLGILKIINSEQIIHDEELKEMVTLCLSREIDISQQFEKLTSLLESKDV
jgi:hypothetical protein